MQQASHHEQRNCCCVVHNKLYFHGEMRQRQEKGKAIAGWQQSRLKTVAHELRGLPSAELWSELCYCVSEWLHMCVIAWVIFCVCWTTIVCAFVWVYLCLCLLCGGHWCQWDYTKAKWKKLEVTGVVWSINKSLPGMLHLSCFEKQLQKADKQLQKFVQHSKVSMCSRGKLTHAFAQYISLPFLWL